MYVINNQNADLDSLTFDCDKRLITRNISYKWWYLRKVEQWLDCWCIQKSNETRIKV